MEDDADIIARHLAGDEKAFPELVERHLRAAYSFAFRLIGVREDAEDIVQESFLKAWKHLPRYSRQSASFKTWFMHIVRNTAIDSLRKKKTIPFTHFESAEGDEPFLDIPNETALEEAIADAHDLALLEGVIAKLPIHYREVLLLYLGSGMTLTEISDVLNAPLNTVKSRFRRGVAALKAAVHPNGGK